MQLGFNIHCESFLLLADYSRETGLKMSKVLIVILVAFVGASVQALTKVSVYYESLCPDSIRFITTQLTPNYNQVSQYIHVDFVPFGKATHNKVNGTWEFDCQHGPNECYGNKMQACGLAQTEDQRTRVDFVNCVMSTSYPSLDENMEPCANASGLSWDSMVECSTDGSGDELLAKYGDQTYAVEPSISFIPTIVYNDVFDAALQANSLTNFLDTVCGVIGNDVC